MRHRFPSARRTAVALGVCLVLGCGNRSTLERSSRRGEDAMGDPTFSSSSSVVLHGSQAEAQLTRAKSAVREGRFEEGVRGFRALYQDQGNPEPVRAEALLRWAEAEGSLLNPQRDPDAAIGRLELFQEQFPRSTLLPDAQDALERLRTQRDAAGAPGGGAGRGPAH